MDVNRIVFIAGIYFFRLLVLIFRSRTIDSNAKIDETP
jgi:hypothetical protein